MALDRTARRIRTLVAAGALAASAPAVGAETVRVPAGRIALEAGAGPAQGGAPAIMVGAGIGIVDDPGRRIDLRGRAWLLRSQEVSDPTDGSMDFTYNGTALAADVSYGWRAGPLEGWLSAGVARLRGSFDDADYLSTLGPVSEDDRVAPIVGAGGRVAIGTQSLLGAEVLYTPRSRSNTTWLEPTPSIGGWGLVFTWTFRAPLATTRVPALEPPESPAPDRPDAPPPVATTPPEPPPPAPPPAPPPPPPPCAPPVHVAEAHRCRPNPVASGFLCTPTHVEGRFADAEACRAACRRGAPSCPADDTAPGAACARCEAGCSAAAAPGCAPARE